MKGLSRLKSLCKEYCLGEINAIPIAIEGGLLHRMFKVVTTKGSYAIKVLNPPLMEHPGVIDNMINSERISRCFAQDIPVISAKKIKDKNLLPLDGYYYMVFDWVDGKSIFSPHITTEHCMKIGDVLGRIHKSDISVEGIEKNIEKSELYQWEYYLEKGISSKSQWYELFAKENENIINLNKKLMKASIRLSEKLVISHRDLDLKNVLWNGGTPHIIDWEEAGYVNPYQELIEVINYWTDDGKGNIDRDKFVALINGYIKHMNLKNIDWSMILTAGYDGMLAWLDYNLKSALGIEGRNKEKIKLGEEQVIETVLELKKYEKKVELLEEWLSAYDR